MSRVNEISNRPRTPAVRRRSTSAEDARFLRALLDARGEILEAGTDLKKIVEVVTRRAQELTHSSGAVVELLDGEELVYWAGCGTVGSAIGLRIQEDASLSGLCVRSGRVLVCDDSETDPRVDRVACRRVALRSMLVAPLPYGDRIIGVLKVVSPWEKAYGPQDVHTLELLNTLIGAAIANAAQHESLHVGDETPHAADSLTLGFARERVRQLIHDDAFDLVFQPIVGIKGGQVLGYEALSRFSAAPARTPDKWFAEAAKVHLGVELELAAARRALAALPDAPGNAFIAVNVSPATVMDPLLEALCLRNDTDRIVFEITEHTSVENYDDLSQHVDRLRRYGIRFAIDDAGAGFASLRHILRLRPDFIKLDMTLTRGIDIEYGNQQMVSALLTFAQGTSATIVAEGIETEAERAALLGVGVAVGQGYLLGAPGPLPPKTAR